jgi:phosphate starvation-inducible PhoH-like protein
MLESRFNVMLTSPSSDSVSIRGSKRAISETAKALELLWEGIQSGTPTKPEDVKYLIGLVSENGDLTADELKSGSVLLNGGNLRIAARSKRQAKYLQDLQQNALTFAIGPAGTGKTYLAVACALRALQRREVRRILLTRPVVEAGESLGFLPGDFKEKINPYLRPLFDAILDMIPAEQFVELRESETIELAPLAYMRGRTLNNAFIVLDEAQNTTVGQMKMFLTRMGENSRVVVTGDPSQMDLPRNVKSGLNFATDVLQNIPSIGVISFGREDIVRHALLTRIIEAFEANGS